MNDYINDDSANLIDANTIAFNSIEEAKKVIEKFSSNKDYKGGSGRSFLHLPLPQAAIKYLHDHGVKLMFPYAEKSLAEILRDKDRT